MCFTRNFTSDMFNDLFHLLNTKYGVKVKACRLCISVWTYRLLSRIGDLSKFLWYSVKHFLTCKIEYMNPSCFHALINFCKASIHMFHTDKINFLGICSVEQVSEIVEFQIDYSLSCNFEFFKFMYLSSICCFSSNI